MSVLSVDLLAVADLLERDGWRPSTNYNEEPHPGPGLTVMQAVARVAGSPNPTDSVDEHVARLDRCTEMEAALRSGGFNHPGRERTQRHVVSFIRGAAARAS